MTPPEPGYLVDLPAPQEGTLHARMFELDLIEFTAPLLPARGTVFVDVAAAGQLAAAGRVVLRSSRAVDDFSAPLGRGVEVRAFARMKPVLEIGLAPLGLKSLDADIEPLPIVMDVFAPEGVVLWSAPHSEMPHPEMELGELARLDLAVEKSTADSQAALDVATPEPPETLMEFGELAQLDMAAEKSTAVPPHSEPPAAMTESVPRPEAAEPAEAPTPSPQESLPPAPPEPPWMPMAVEVILAGRGRPVQVFSTPLFPTNSVRIPRTGAMPLRPVIVLGALPEAPAPKSTEAVASDKPPVSIKSAIDQAAPPPAPTQAARRAPVKSVSGRPVTSKPDASVAEPAAAAPVPSPVASPAPSPAASPVPPIDLRMDLGLPSLQLHTRDTFWTRLPGAAKIVVAALLVLALSGLVYLATNGGKATASTAGHLAVPATPTAPVIDAVWLADWAPDADAKRGRRVSILRGSMALTDYRVEFQSQIESKALGWVYRATDPKNYYVNRLEIVKAGLESKIALVRFAVLGGKEQSRAQHSLNIAARPDTLYKIRFEAVKDHFSTWIGDQKVDEWSDDHLKSGGVGMYSENGESISMKGSVNVIPLVNGR